MNTKITNTAELREYIASQRANALPPVGYDPDPILEPDTHIGTPARLTVDDVLTHRQAEVEVLRVAAHLVASLQENADLFDRFLTDALGGE